MFDSFVKDRILDHQFMNFEDFLKEIKILVVMVEHDNIKNYMTLIKEDLALGTKNTSELEGSYKL